MDRKNKPPEGAIIGSAKGEILLAEKFQNRKIAAVRDPGEGKRLARQAVL